MLSSSIAARLGRPNLARGARTSADLESAGGTAGPYVAANTGAEVSLGKLTAGTGGLVVVGLLLFYLWTRQHQQ